MKKNNKILVVEDQLIIAKVYSSLLSKKGFEVMVSSNGSDAFEKAKAMQPGLILMDIHLNDAMTGLDIARKLRADGCKSRIVFTTGNSLDSTKIEAADIENSNVLIKPVEMSELEKFLIV